MCQENYYCKFIVPFHDVLRDVDSLGDSQIYIVYSEIQIILFIPMKQDYYLRQSQITAIRILASPS